MTTDPPVPEGLTLMAYDDAIAALDAAVCEAMAVGQAQAGRYPEIHIAWGTHIFTGLCSHATAMIRAVPRSRWVTSDSEDWNFCTVAGHARAILEGALLLDYLVQEPSGESEIKARINLMHLRDCTSRIELMERINPQGDLSDKRAQQEELRDRLRANDYFKSLPAQVQQSRLTGKRLMLAERETLLAGLGMPPDTYYAIYDFWSQHTHILPLSFYSVEPNGRGTGIENEVDRTYIASACQISASIMSRATDWLVSVFPDVADRRRGLNSRFEPGPRSNRYLPPPARLNDGTQLGHSLFGTSPPDEK